MARVCRQAASASSLRPDQKSAKPRLSRTTPFRAAGPASADRAERPRRPAGERLPHARVHRPVAREHSPRRLEVPLPVEAGAARQVARLVLPEPEVEQERRVAPREVGVRRSRRVLRLEQRRPDHHRRGRRSRQPDERENTDARGHVDAESSPSLVAILSKVMPSYRELLQQVKSEIDECTPREAAARSDEPRLPRRARARRVGGGPHPRRRLDPAREPRGPRRAGAARPRPARDRLLRRRLALRLRHADARAARLHERRQPRRRLHRLEAQRLPHAAPARSGPSSTSAHSRHLLIRRSARPASSSCSTRASC